MVIAYGQIERAFYVNCSLCGEEMVIKFQSLEGTPDWLKAHGWYQRVMPMDPDGGWTCPKHKDNNG
jgi:hypothetical protein